MALMTSKFAPKLAAATAVAAAFSLLAAPAAAVDLPRPAGVKAYDGDAGNANRHRRWRHDRGIDAGDVIAGVLVLGAIAAVADAANDRQEERRDRDYRYPERYPYPDGAGYRGVDQRGYQSGGIDRAVEMCVDAVERGGDRVGSVDSANRDGNGWNVTGALEQGAGYSCRIDNDGRISDVRVDGYDGSYGYGSAPAEDYEYDDDYYAQAREQQGYADPNAQDDGYDGRYETAEAPDFEQ